METKLIKLPENLESVLILLKREKIIFHKKCYTYKNYLFTNLYSWHYFFDIFKNQLFKQDEILMNETLFFRKKDSTHFSRIQLLKANLLRPKVI